MLANETESLRKIYPTTFNFANIKIKLFCLKLLGNAHYLKASSIIKLFSGKILAKVIELRCFKICYFLSFVLQQQVRFEDCVEKLKPRVF